MQLVFPLSKKFRNSDQDLSNQEVEKGQNDTVVLERENCLSQSFEF